MLNSRALVELLRSFKTNEIESTCLTTLDGTLFASSGDRDMNSLLSSISSSIWDYTEQSFSENILEKKKDELNLELQKEKEENEEKEEKKEEKDEKEEFSLKTMLLENENGQILISRVRSLLVIFVIKNCLEMGVVFKKMDALKEVLNPVLKKVGL
ncbi:ragulator complex protein lamtor2 [Anaeramoeba flamelloides]|uniref:Ragulator complex protein lamtor2 n=1 Tax=Anaeramoeba flamelloides TaxID=1746091 RepID=A0AAV7ZII0_9EUKA|nr:ragulator complex protein lamtor2 [Anaeramoeba flamelloides]KAJ6227115.1 ragulator complex protein lamtor2 [Anaeramoeba flamelloides]